MNTKQITDAQVVSVSKDITMGDVSYNLPQSGKRAEVGVNVASAVQVVNMIDLLGSSLGIVPPGVIPLAVNAIVGITALGVKWFLHRKIAKQALLTESPLSR